MQLYISLKAESQIVDNLTTTEFSIAMLANRRWTNMEIAEHMNLSEHTIKRYMSDIYPKIEYFKQTAAASVYASINSKYEFSFLFYGINFENT